MPFLESVMTGTALREILVPKLGFAADWLTRYVGFLAEG
jgi:hypothetical protein